MQETVKSICNHFFSKLGTDFSDLQIEKGENNIFKISLKSEDSHLLIGPHGKNLDTLSHLLKLLLSKHFEGYITVHIEINDYMQQKDEKLQKFIESKIAIVKNTGKEIILPFFSSYDRKKVHGYVNQLGGNVYTQSQGEGKDRRIHLCMKEEKITIDIDGNDI